MPKRDLSNALAGNVNAQPMVRGRGYELSTTNIETSTEPTLLPRETIQRDNAKVDKELIKAYKLLAVQQERKLYEVVEEALRKYLEEQNRQF